MSSISKTYQEEAPVQEIVQDLVSIIEQSRCKVASYVNQEITLMYWQIGKYILQRIDFQDKAEYGKKIVATVSQQLTEKYGSGYTPTALFRMLKVARIYPDEKTLATLSQQLTWSHLVELITIEQETKRLFYQNMAIQQRWSLRQLRKHEDEMLYERTLIAAQPEEKQIVALSQMEEGELTPDLLLKSSYIIDFLGLHGYYSEKDLENAILQQMERFIMELGQGFAFLERQKRISIDGIDYYIDLLFYHRSLNRLVVIDLKLGKFRPEYKGQMELYLKYLQRYEQNPHEKSPIGLLLCSEGNNEHVELMMLDDENIHVAQYLTALPAKQWFIDKLNRSIAIAAEHKLDKKSTTTNFEIENITQ